MQYVITGHSNVYFNTVVALSYMYINKTVSHEFILKKLCPLACD